MNNNNEKTLEEKLQGLICTNQQAEHEDNEASQSEISDSEDEEQFVINLDDNNFNQGNSSEHTHNSEDTTSPVGYKHNDDSSDEEKEIKIIENGKDIIEEEREKERKKNAIPESKWVYNTPKKKKKKDSKKDDKEEDIKEGEEKTNNKKAKNNKKNINKQNKKNPDDSSPDFNF